MLVSLAHVSAIDSHQPLCNDFGKKRGRSSFVFPDATRRPPPQLIAKIQRVMRAAEQMQKNGQDVTPVQRVMERVGPLMQQGKLEEVNRLVDEALKLTGAANE